MKHQKFYPAAALKPWDGVEILSLVDCGGGVYDVCDDDEPDIAFWTVNLHQVTGGLETIADMDTREEAEELAEILMNAIASYHDFVK